MVSIDISMCNSNMVVTDLHCSVSVCLPVSLGTHQKSLMNRKFFWRRFSCTLGFSYRVSSMLYNESYQLMRLL